MPSTTRYLNDVILSCTQNDVVASRRLGLSKLEEAAWSLRGKSLVPMKPDDIISYPCPESHVERGKLFGDDVLHAEKATVQKGMNYDLGKGYSVFLMSVRSRRAHSYNSSNSG